MKKIIHYSVLASVLLASLVGCSQKQIQKPETNQFLITVTRPDTTLHLVDINSDTIVRQCHMQDIGPGPGTVVMAPDKKTAFVLANHFGEVYGIDIDTCELVFSTQQTEANIRVKSLASLTLSPDGTKLYTHQNRVKLMNDHYELLAPQIAVFDTRAGINVKASQTFAAPRQITIMDTLDSGDILLGGQDIFQMNPETGDYHTLLKSLSHSDPQFAPRDVLTVWPMGTINHEMVRLYSTAKFNGEPGDMNNAQLLWGLEKVDLATGIADSTEFGPLTTALFSGARRPGHPDKMYGTLNYLKEYEISSQTELRSLELEHTYYTLNFNKDGSKLYLLGADADIAVYNADTFDKITNIQLTGDGSMANNVVFERPR